MCDVVITAPHLTLHSDRQRLFAYTTQQSTKETGNWMYFGMASYFSMWRQAWIKGSLEHGQGVSFDSWDNSTFFYMGCVVVMHSCIAASCCKFMS